jgi:hypothetical protein
MPPVQGQVKHRFAELSRKNSPSGSLTGKPVVELYRTQNSNTVTPSYTHSKLIEINSHSLFSRWFSESGKLVQKLFASVTEMIEDETSFVVVLIGVLPSSPHFAYSTTKGANAG